MRYYNFNRDHAAKAHAEANHRYDKDGKNHPYIYHLDMAVEVARQFKHLISEKDYFHVETGIYFHDAIEDVRYAICTIRKTLR